MSVPYSSLTSPERKREGKMRGGSEGEGKKEVKNEGSKGEVKKGRKGKRGR